MIAKTTVAAVADHWADSLARGGGEEERNKYLEISLFNYCTLPIVNTIDSLYWFGRVRMGDSERNAQLLGGTVVSRAEDFSSLCRHARDK